MSKFYFSKYYTEEHRFSVLKELKEFIENNDNNIDDFFDQLAKNIAFTDIMGDFYWRNGKDDRHKNMQKYSNELRSLQSNILNEITETKEELSINKLKDFLDREIEKSEAEIKKIK